MMALAMVVICRTGRCAGSGGRSPLGTGHGKPRALGLQSGTAVALIAIVIDRSLYLYGERTQQHRKVGH